MTQVTVQQDVVAVQVPREVTNVVVAPRPITVQVGGVGLPGPPGVAGPHEHPSYLTVPVADTRYAPMSHVDQTINVHGIRDTSPADSLNDLPDLTLIYQNGLI